ncbi:TPA: hypothetical protein ACGVAZ_004548 [Vibrio vulnificus]
MEILEDDTYGCFWG